MSKRFYRVDKCDRCGDESDEYFEPHASDAHEKLLTAFDTVTLYVRGGEPNVGGDVCKACSTAFRKWWKASA